MSSWWGISTARSKGIKNSAPPKEEELPLQNRVSSSSSSSSSLSSSSPLSSWVVEKLRGYKNIAGNVLTTATKELATKSDNLFTQVMGACFSTPEIIIASNAGGEEDFHKRFLEDRVLGEGQFGVVKLVHDMKANNGQGEFLACKTLRKGVVFKDNVLYSPLKPQVMQNEIEILKTLNGDHYCLQLVGVYETPKLILVVTEFCSGGVMTEYVSKQEEMHTEDASRIAFQLLRAVNHCDKHGVIHRDIKPDNTMFKDPSRGAELRLIDFGSGTIDNIQEAPSQNHTTFAGSAFYISPEMFQRTYTSKTDVWSVGATLYVLVAGYPADQLQKAFNILQKSNNRDLRTLPGMPEEMPDSFIDLLDKLLTYKYKQRPTAGSLLHHEFVQFHTLQEQVGIEISEIAAEAVLTEDRVRDRHRTRSIRLTGSVRAHSMFLNYKQYERSLTTLLATLLSAADFNTLLSKLEQHVAKQETSTEDDEDNQQKLKIVIIQDLLSILQQMEQERVLTMIAKLPGNEMYEAFAYHIALLKQFQREDGVSSASEPRRRGIGRKTTSMADREANSVHGNRVFERSKSSSDKAMARSTSGGTLDRFLDQKKFGARSARTLN